MATINKIPKCPPLRFPDFNDDWTQTTLGEATIIIMGQSPSSVNYNEEGIGLPLIQGNADMCSGTTIVRFYTSEITKEALKNDIIMSVRAPVGALAITPFRCCIGRGVCAIRADKYIYYYLQGCSKIWSKYSAGSTFDSITGENIRHLPISLPSLEEQKKIADFLSLIDERIQSSIETIRELKNQKAALLNQLFSQKLRFPDFNDEWTQTTLGEIGETYTGLSGKSSEAFGKGSPYITYKMVYDGVKINLCNTEYVYVSESEKQNQVRLGDILFTTSSETPEETGLCSVLLSSSDELYLNSFCFGYRLKEESLATSIFLGYALRSPLYRIKLSTLAQGSTRYNISKSEVMRMPISLPSLEEQKKIADFLSLVDERIEVEEQLLQQYEKQKRYLLRQMFV